ncbi:TonB-dependent receptor [Pelomonas cellulosilytica]|uniref:TonB-dependent receptor n=1 Tax=Pelomonas cellulosilytica TaxID=2906762 RepID=A0ABS8XQU1_9BURK|nr:TonB-dependent receptor [Pelomonas sp. P8]MCE4552966.1 TonB-dependent receptor [Pelomonas sp. P8]
MLKNSWGGTPALRWTPLALAVSAALAGQARAQEAAPAAEQKPTAAKVDDKDKNQLETVVVTGIRRSIQSAIERKRTAAAVTDSIVAEDVDQFPDKNVGEALSRVTGVQLTRDFGEGTQVSIRGVEPDLNRIEINGMSVLNTSGTGGRGADLRELASELIASIDVIKGVLPNVTEGGVGATVSINTRKPLDFAKRTVAVTLSGEQASLRGGLQPRGSLLAADKFLGGKLGLMANLVYDKVYTRGDFARNTGWTFLRDWDNSPEKTRNSLDTAAAAVTTPAGCSALTGASKTACDQQWYDYAPNTPRVGIWTRDHKRSTAELAAQYKFSSNFDAEISYQANTQNQRLNDRNYGTSLGNNANNAASLRAAQNRLATAAGGKAPVYNADGSVKTAGTCGAPSATATPAGMTFDNHVVTGYTVGDCMYAESNSNGALGGYNAFSTSARDFALDIKSRYLRTGARYKDDLWIIEGMAGAAKADYENQTNNISMAMSAPGLKVSLDDQHLPHFTFPAGYDPADPNSYFRADIQYRPSVTNDSENTAKLDFQRAISEVPLLSRLWFGGQITSKHSKQYGGGQRVVSNGATASTADDVLTMTSNVNGALIYDRQAPALAPATTNTYANPYNYTKYVDKATMAALAGSVLQPTGGSGFFSGYGVSGYPAGWLSPNYDVAAKSFDTSLFNFGHLYESPASDGKTYPQLPAFDIRENVAAGYLRLDFDTELWGLPIDGNFGARYARTKVKATGTSNMKMAVWNATSGQFDVSGNATDILTLDRTYNDVLPSFNVSATGLDGKFITRFGWGKVMSRPNLSQIAPNVSCTQGQGSDLQHGGDGIDDCSAGNPGLKPYRANKYDLSFEYYPNKGDQFSVGLFRNDIKSYVLPAKVIFPSVDFFGDGKLYDVTMWANGEGAITQGVELAARKALTFLPGWASGFGVDLNYTRMNFKYRAGKELINTLDGSVLPYPGMSKNAYNVGVWYDQGMVNARLAYHFRDKYYTGTNDVTGNPNFRDKTAYLDAKVQLRLTNNFTVALEGKNLTDQAELTYAGDLTRPNELAWSGRRYFLTVSYKL